MSERSKTYRDHEGWSVSTLKRFFNPKYLSTKRSSEPKKHFDIGTITDAILTDGEKLMNGFVIIDKLPEPWILKIIHHIFDNGMLFDDVSITDVRKLLQLQATWGDAAVLSWVYRYTDYYEGLLDCQENDKQMITTTDYTTGFTIAQSVKDNKYTGEYFINTSEWHTFYQCELYSDIVVYNAETEEQVTTPVKGLADLIRVNIQNKTIQIIDVKTTGKSTNDFNKVIKDNRYDIQVAGYTLILKNIIKGNGVIKLFDYNGAEVDLDLTDYKVEFPAIIMETTVVNDIGNPLIIELCKKDYLMGLYGGYNNYANYPGITASDLSCTLTTLSGYYPLLTQAISYISSEQENEYKYNYSFYKALKENGKLQSAIW